MSKESARHNAETALINALAMLRSGDTEQALTLAIVAVGRIGSLVPRQVLERVSAGVAVQIVAAQAAPVG
jgi:hypothetical protein